MTGVSRLVNAGADAAWPAGQTIETATRWAEIDVSVLRNNVATLCRHVGAGVAVMAMVKANGYGHGAVLTARAALEGGATWLGVASADEALQLRDAGVTAPVLVVGWTPAASLPALVEAGVDITVFTTAAVEAVAGVATPERHARVQLKLDTGMGRLGAREADVAAVVAALRRHAGRLDVTGIFSHLASSESDPAFTADQNRRFIASLDSLRDVYPDAVAHLANSGAILRDRATHHQMVRPGIAIYGYPGDPASALDLRPALSLFARVSHLKTVDPGDSVGYGREWIAHEKTRVATISAGYADGIFRKQGNRGTVMIAGVRCPIIGRVSMDQIAADVSAISGLNVGDRVLIVGTSNGVTLGADEVAAASETIAYEVLTSISARVPRMVAGV